MWTLKNNLGRKIPLDPDIITTVGRRNATIILENDNSISKLHAKITVAKADDGEFKNDLVCTIKDAGSKYGTYLIKKNKVVPISTEGHRCQSMDRIKFGLQQHEFTLLYTPSYDYLSLVSRIYNKEKDELIEVVNKVNGLLCDEWNPQCTHLTCPTVKLTEKVACALVAGLYIVTKDYWYALLDAIHEKQNQPLPNPANFIPKIHSSILVTERMSLLPNPARKSLFDGKIFIFFLQNQQVLFSRMIELAGGKTIIYDETWKPNDCCEKHIIVIQSMDVNQPSQTPTYQYRSVCLRLSQDKLRTIPESEIPLAILYCSTEQYCNPRYCYDKLLQRSERNKAMENVGETLAADTQEIKFKRPRKPQQDQVIPESVPIDSQISSQMQSQMSLKTRDQICKPNKSLINRQNVIIPETASMDTGISLQMQSQISLKSRNGTSSTINKSNINRQNVIPETLSKDTQSSSRTQSQMSLLAGSQNLVAAQMQSSRNDEKNGVRPRMVTVETLVSPLFSSTLRRNPQKSNGDGLEISKLHNSNNFIDDDDEDSDCESTEQALQSHVKKNSSSTTMKKRTMEAVSPVLPNDETNNKKNIAKRRKLNRTDNTDIIQSLDNERNARVSGENILNRTDEDVAALADGLSNIGRNPGHVSHYFSRNNFHKPKCIIPERLTMDDMYEWKPNRHL